MGMIMKDGVPYGGVYPIDDVPTQGSDNTVKSGGVHSALSNKVDKVAGKGLSTNDYSDTEKGKVADNTAAIEAIENVLGAKNVLPNNATSQTFQGVIFTVNADGSITLSGSLQGVSYTGVNIAENYNIPIDCIMNGMPSNVPHVFLECVASDWSGIVKRDYGSGTYINASEFVGKSALVRIIVESGADLSTPVTIYPMIRDARIKDSTYVPYSMTNKQLTDRVSELKVYKHGETYSVSQTKDLMFGYANTTSQIILQLPILVADNVVDSQLSASVPSSFGIATISGIVNLYGVTVNSIKKSCYGVQLILNCNENTGLTPGTVIIAGLHATTITF